MSHASVRIKSNPTAVALAALFLVLLLGATALALAIEAGLPWPGVAGLGLAVSLAGLVARRGESSRADLLGWCASSVVFLVTLLTWHRPAEVVVTSPAVWVGLLGATALAASARVRDVAGKARWRAGGLL